MNRKNRCPYCGRRVTYGARFSCRRKAEYVCSHCRKESKVSINKKVILVFIICAILSASIMIAWIMLDLTSNPLGILLVAIPLIIFGLVSPNFVRFDPLKKYQKSMEAKRAGIEYSDNLTVSELDDEIGYAEGSNQFQINNDVFNKIKAERNAAKSQPANEDLVSDSAEFNTADKKENSYVEVMSDVRENHSVSDDAPLKKIHSEGSKINRSRHYIDDTSTEEGYKSDNKEKINDSENNKSEKEKSETNRYSANRRF